MQFNQIIEAVRKTGRKYGAKELVLFGSRAAGYETEKKVLRKAFECGLISDDGWMAMLADRNNLAHDYDGEIVNDVCARLIESYLDLFWDFSKAAGKYYPD